MMASVNSCFHLIQFWSLPLKLFDDVARRLKIIKNLLNIFCIVYIHNIQDTLSHILKCLQDKADISINIFMQFYRIINLVRMVYRAQE